MPNSSSPLVPAAEPFCSFFRCQTSLSGRIGNTRYCSPDCREQAVTYRKTYWDCQGCGLQRPRAEGMGDWCARCLTSGKAQRLDEPREKRNKAKRSETSCHYCAAHFQALVVSGAHAQCVCWPCWNKQLSQVVPQLQPDPGAAPFQQAARARHYLLLLEEWRDRMRTAQRIEQNWVRDVNKEAQFARLGEKLDHRAAAVLATRNASRRS